MLHCFRLHQQTPSQIVAKEERLAYKSLLLVFRVFKQIIARRAYQLILPVRLDVNETKTILLLEIDSLVVFFYVPIGNLLDAIWSTSLFIQVE